MAVNQKEYKMLFMIASSLGANFTTSFRTAQDEIKKLNEAQKSLAKEQGMIDSYKRLQAELNNTSQKAADLARRDQELAEAVGAGKISNEQYYDALRLLNKEREKTNDAIQSNEERIRTLAEALGLASPSAEEFARKEAEIAEAAKKNADAIQEQQDKMSMVNATMEAFTELAQIGMVSALKDLASAYGECIKASADFQESLSNVEALTGATETEMGQLEQKALSLAASTKFTATQMGDAMGYMGMAGWDASEMLNGLSGVTALAAASGEDLATVSDIVTDNLTAFGLGASDTARFADVLAAAATNANTNVGIMGETFKNSAAVAGALGYSVEDVAAAIGVMANNGVKGSIAGTALRNIFNGFLKGVTLTSDAFGEYEFATANADGTMKGLGETLDELRGKFAMMTEVEKVTNAKDIAGMRGYNGLLSLMNASTDDFLALRQSIESSAGSAQKMADIKLDNLNGQITIMKSAWDAIKISLGGEFQDELQALVERFTSVLHAVNEFINDHPYFVKGILSIGGAMLGLVGAVEAYNVAMKIGKTVTDALLLESLAPLLPTVAAVAAVIGVLATSWAAFQDSELYAHNQLSASSREQMDNIKELEAQYNATSEAMGKNSEEAKALKYELDNAKATFENTKIDFKDLQKEIYNTVDAYHELVKASNDANGRTDEKEAGVGSLINKLNGLVDANGKVIGSESEVVSIISALNDEMPSLSLSYDKSTGSINKTIAAVKHLTDENIRAERYENDKTRYSEEVRNENKLLQEQKKAEEDLLAAQRAVNYEKGLAASEEDAYLNGFQEEWEAYHRISSAVNENKFAMEELNRSMEEYEALNGSSTPEGMINSLAGELDFLIMKYDALYTASSKSIKEQYTMWDEAAEVVPTKIEELNKNIEGQLTYWQDYSKNLNILNQFAADNDIYDMQAILASYASKAGTEEVVNLVAGLAQAAKSGDGEAITELVDNMRELSEQQDITAKDFGKFTSDFDYQSKELLMGVGEAVKSLDMTEEARTAALNTMQGYIDGISNPSNLSEAQRAIGAFGVAMRAAFMDAIPTAASVADGGHGGGTSSYSTGRGGRAHGGSTRNLFAKGTSSAPLGWAMVGENGPELMYMTGGERVLSTPDTERVLRDTDSPQSNNVSINFNISGNADSGTLAQLQAYADDFAERVIDVIKNAEYDSTRRAYV